MKYNAIVGLPRSGSTLLCNILNQNPRFHATKTSITGNLVAGLIETWSKTAETKSYMLEDDFAKRQKATVQGMIGGWFYGKGEVIFDKSRHWGSGHAQFTYLFPDGKIVCVVRNPLAIIASILKQDAKNPLLGTGTMLMENIDSMCSSGGILGSNSNSVLDLYLKVSAGNVHFIKYEDLVNNPIQTLGSLYAFLGEEPFAHDFINIENTCAELDVMYNNKFPHNGCGELKPVLEEYHKWLTPALQEHIIKGGPGYADGLSAIFDKFYNTGGST